MTTVLKVALGIVFLALGAWLIWFWRWQLELIIKGFLGIALVFLGLIFLAIAKE